MEEIYVSHHWLSNDCLTDKARIGLIKGFKRLIILVNTFTLPTPVLSSEANVTRNKLLDSLMNPAPDQFDIQVGYTADTDNSESQRDG